VEMRTRPSGCPMTLGSSAVMYETMSGSSGTEFYAAKRLPTSVQFTTLHHAPMYSGRRF
jgi:hypothetical protein